MIRLQSKIIATRTWVFVLTIILLRTSSAFAAEQTSSPDPLLTLARDVWAQFDLAYRSQPVEYDRHRVQFNAVIEAWRAAPNPAVADKLLTGWMQAAIQASMPGSRTPLPPMPQFVPNAQRRPPLAGMDLLKTQYASPKPARPTITQPVATTVTDPFQDDPFLDDAVSEQ